MNLIIYAIRVGYEIKVWLYNVPKTATEEEILELAKAEYKRVGVELKDDDTFEWEAF